MSDGAVSRPMQTMSVNSEGIAQDPKSAAVRWLFGQEASTVALFSLLIGGGYMTHWHITVGAPATRKEMAEINKANNDAHKEIMNACTASHEKAAAQTAAAVEKLATQNAVAVEKFQTAVERLGDKIRDSGKD